MNHSIRRVAALGATALVASSAIIASLAGTGGAETTPATGTLKVQKVVVGSTTTDTFRIEYDCSGFVGAFDLANGQQNGVAVPAGSVCTVTEPPVSGFTTTYANNPAVIVAGQISTVVVTNTFVPPPPPPPPPTTSPRTIGYWSNWNTCGTNGNQTQNASRTGNPLLDAQLPISLGSYVVDTCQKGVAVFAAATGRFMENQLAAQLLAAEANRKVGTAACIDTVITQADALLTRVGYAGPPSAIIGAQHPDRSRATSLKDALDRYNNGLGCPT